jgi:hypothetical protein
MVLRIVGLGGSFAPQSTSLERDGFVEREVRTAAFNPRNNHRQVAILVVSVIVLILSS